MDAGPAYRQPQFRPACARCGTDPGEGLLYSPQGEPLCRPCFHAGSQAAADARAQNAFGGGMLYLGNDSALQTGMRGDLETKMLRRCAKCKAHEVTVVHVTFHYTNGLTRGRTYLNKCAACSVQFKTESTLRTIVQLASGVLIALVGGVAIPFASGWAWLLVLCLPLGLWTAGVTVQRIIARFTNPLVPRAPGA